VDAASGKVELLLKDFPYAEDGLLLWEALEEWVGDYLALYYKDDAAVVADPELAAWWDDIK
jgi:linoleate 9S-lipoxygenase